jgi:hypothetical protein
MLSGARGGPAGALAPPNASYNKLIYAHKPSLEAIFREILHAWPPQWMITMFGPP